MKNRWLICTTASLAAGLGACGSDEASAPAADRVAAPAAAVAVDAPSAAPAPSATDARPVIEQELAYGEGQKSNLEGYLAMPQDAAEPLPGILVIHESWGLNDAVKSFARRLAAEGYVVLAVDLYGGATAATPDRAQALMTELYAEPEAARNNLKQAYDYLDRYAFAPRIAAVGFDLGAGWALQTGLLFPDTLDALVLYYGQVTMRREDLATLEMPILGFFGGEDASVPVREVVDFRTVLMELGKVAEVLIVPGVGHAFANPTAPGYDQRAADETWAQTLAFLQRQLKLSTPTQ